MEAYESRDFYKHLKKNKRKNSVPLLVKRYDAFFKQDVPPLESFPGSRAMTYRNTFSPILSFADSSHIELLEKFVDERPDLAELKPKLEEVRARPAHAPTPEPAFRLGTTPVKIPPK